MTQPEAAAAIKQWMEQFAQATCAGQVVETSAGAGPGREYAYLHFRTADGEHVALVLRAVEADGSPEVLAIPLAAGPEQIRDVVDAATHGTFG